MIEEAGKPYLGRVQPFNKAFLQRVMFHWFPLATRRIH
jgi:hypothetical protein